MARDMRSLASAVAMFKHESDVEAEKLFDRMDGVRVRRDRALGKTHAHIDAEERSIGDVESFVADLERSNGGPPLDDSPPPSASSAPSAPSVSPPVQSEPPGLPEPHASWAPKDSGQGA